MMIRVFARHFFNSPETVDRFPSIIRKLELLAAVWPVEMIATFLPTVHPPPVQTHKVTCTLSVSGANEGGGSKVYEGFFNREGGITLLVDGDMQSFGKEEIAILKHLLVKMKQEGTAFGAAARTFVHMHHNPLLNNLRIAQEAFYLSFGLPPLPDNPSHTTLEALHPVYQTLGDTFSGCIAIDLDHPVAQQIKQEVERIYAQGRFRGFALEYYLGIRFAQLGAVTSAYLPTRPNHAVTDRSAEAVKEMIRKDWQELRQSPIGEALARHIAEPAVQRRVAELVSVDAMQETLGLLR